MRLDRSLSVQEAFDRHPKCPYGKPAAERLRYENTLLSKRPAMRYTNKKLGYWTLRL